MFCFTKIAATHFNKCITLIAIVEMFNQEQSVEVCDATKSNNAAKVHLQKKL